MATSKETNDELNGLLTCTICLETFKDPRYLPCLHTFCEQCIKTYIVSTVNDKKEEGFRCPVCRRSVSIKEDARPEKSVEKLPINYFINSLIDSFCILKSEKLCSACQLENISTKAASWCTVCSEAYCDSCEKQHRKFRISMKHKIISLDELKTSDSFINNTSTVTCDTHPDRQIEVFCLNHSEPCCTLCATIDHRKCDDVIAIEKAVSGVKTSEQTIKLREKLQKNLLTLARFIKANKENVSSVEDEYKGIGTEINNLKETVTKHICSMFEALNTELTAKKKELLIELENGATEASSLHSTLETWERILEACMKHGSDLQCLVEVHRLVTKEKQISKRVGKLAEKQKTKTLQFTPNQTAKNFSEVVTSFGRLVVTGSRRNINMKTGNVKVLFTINVSQGSGTFYGSGLFLGQSIIINDYYKCRIVKYDSDGVYQSELQIPAKPYDITKAGEGKVAVGMKNLISVIDITNMRSVKTISTPVTFYGLQYVENAYIVGFPEKLTWLNETSGAIIDQKTTSGQSYYLHATKRGKVMYGTDSDTVICEVNGEHKFSYKCQQLWYPRGIDEDFEGNAYICACDTGNIIQITEDGQLIRIIPPGPLGIQQPWVIRFEPDSNKFLLADLKLPNVVICEII